MYCNNLTTEGRRTPHLKGHTLGNIPDDHIHATTISGAPDISRSRSEARKAADGYAMAADLAVHSRTLKTLAGGNQQNQQIAAQILSSSCVNSGHLLRTVPTRAVHMGNDKFRQRLRLQFGVPTVVPPSEWSCNCSDQSGPQHEDFPNVHACEGDAGEVVAGASFATQPLHGLMCRRRWKRVTYRHDQIRDALRRALNRVTGVKATCEPRVNAVDQRRGDVKVTKGGNSWVLDVHVVCPATASRVAAWSTHTVPGAAAQRGSDEKKRKYADVPNFVPFVVETGGRLCTEARDFVDRIVDADEPADKGAAHKIFKAVSWALMRQQSFMLATIAQEIPAPERAAL